MDINNQSRILKYKSKTDARGRIIYFISGVGYLVITLCMIYILYKIVVTDKANAANKYASQCDGAVSPEACARDLVISARNRSEAISQKGGAKCQLPTILYLGVIIVALGLVWTTLRIRYGNDFLLL